MARLKTEIKNISYDEERNKYYINMNYGYNEIGKQIKKTKTANSKAEAKRILKLFEADKIKGEISFPQKDTLEEWLNYWMENIVRVNREKTTYAGYKIIVEKHIIPHIGKVPLQKVTPKIIQEFYNAELSEKDENSKPKLSSNTVKKHHTLLKTALKCAVTQEIIRSNPVEKVEPPRYNKPEISFYTIDKLKQLFELVESDYILKPAVNLAARLGLRREEIAGLKWENIDFENNLVYIKEVRAMANREIVIKKTKNTSSTRTLALVEDLKLTLLEIRANHEENLFLFCKDLNMASESKNTCINNDFVVSNEFGEPVHPGYLSSVFGKFIKRNKLPHITLHGLRHTMASVGNDAGLTLYDISKILGHSSPDVTGKIYTHLFDETQREAMTKIHDKMK